jgi:hypothetical protein
MSLVHQITARLGEYNIDHPADGAVRRVLDTHREFRVTDSNGKHHSICRECCCDQYEDIRTEECRDNHHKNIRACWPCSTVCTIAEALGVRTDVYTGVA